MTLKLPLSIAFSLIITIVLSAVTPFASASPTVSAQTKRRAQAKPQPAPQPTPTPTFDTLIPTNSYRLYVEVRSVGQLIRSNSINEILEPIMQLASPPKELRTFVKWLNNHADEVMTSRMLFAT